MKHIKLPHDQVKHLAEIVASRLLAIDVKTIYPIPRGGVPAAYLIQQFHNFSIVDKPEMADAFVDDIIDSGATEKIWTRSYPEKKVFALVDKKAPYCPYQNDWVIFPWEDNSTGSIEGAITRLLQFIGEDVTRDGLIDTPKRVARAMGEWFSGYHQDPKAILKMFTDGAENYNQMIVVKDLPIYSKCEHHMSDIFGTVTIAYIPNGKIVGLSKLSRLVDVFARRLQVQERLTQQIADTLNKHLAPVGVAVLLKARHMCMESRGINKQGHHTITTAFHGAFSDKPATRGEFMSLIK